MTVPARTRSLGITVMPDYAQSESVDAVMENIIGLGCDVLCTMPSVAERCAERLGMREPPADAGAGLVRTLDRPLWGDTALWMRTAPSFVPNSRFYRDSPYAPPEPDALTQREGHVVAQMLSKAKRAGMTTQLQVMAAAPPALRVQQRPDAGADKPLTVFGTPVRNRVDANVSLASEGLRAYMRALVADLLASYPDCDALRFDWPEYPPYALDSLLFDFSPPAVKRGQDLGHDVVTIQARALEGLRKVRREVAARAVAIDAMLRPGGWAADLLAFRSAIVTDYVGALTAIVKEASYGRVGVVMQAFPPPLNHLSGLDFKAVDGFPDEIAIKHYTMHWPMIERGYVERLAAVTGLGQDVVFTEVHRWLGLNGAAATLDALHYPEPHEPHPADGDALRRTVETAAGQINRSRLSVIAHGYGPLGDVERRFRALLETPCRHLHLNRYGYLSDAKIARLGAIWREAA